MAFRHGKSTTVLLGSVNLSPYLDSMDLAVDTDQADSTTFGTTWKSEIAGVSSGKVDFSGYYDPTQASLPTLFLSMLPAALTYCPGGGATIGDAARLVSAIDTSHAESSPVGGLVAIKGSFTADGAVGFGAVLNPVSDLGASPATGANYDGLAATSTGWMAHLHVTAVTGAGTWVVKLVDASASNFSDVTDVTGGAFTTTAVATSQRLVSAAGATLRRYVRVVATRTGGAVGDRITFGLVVARNI